MSEASNLTGGEFLLRETDPQDVFTPEDFDENQRMIAQTVAFRHPDKVKSLVSVMSSTGDPKLRSTTPRERMLRSNISAPSPVIRVPYKRTNCNERNSTKCLMAASLTSTYIRSRYCSVRMPRRCSSSASLIQRQLTA